MSIKGRIVKIYANEDERDLLHHLASLFEIDADWSESDHPRDKNGKFTGGGSSESKESEIESLKKQISGMSRFGEQGKKRSELVKRLEELSPKQEKAPEKKIERPNYGKFEAKEFQSFPVDDHKNAQFEIIQNTNPMHDDYHTGIRKPENIRSPEEALDPEDDAGYLYPDFTKEDGKKALKSGKITLYSSHPIENGTFVTPSKMMAGDYSGGGKIYSKEVSVKDVAWINADEGQFASVRREGDSANDGGPGSGNYGHKGRPGKRGGSGKGGGKQYRGGRSDIGYHGSRNDWLNGLQGERQHKAARAIASAKREIEKTTKLKPYFTDEEYKKVWEKAGYKKPPEQMSPEEYILTRGNAEEADELNMMMREARSWDEKKDKMINENLSDDEKKALEYLSKPGVGKIQNNSVRQLLEAKAMGMDLDVEIPDEIQYEAGTKERPPKTGVPKDKDENREWFDHVPREKQEKIRETLASVGLTPEGFAGTDMNEAESRLETKVVQDIAQNITSTKAVDALNEYLTRKESALEVDVKGMLANGTANNLTDQQKKIARELLELGMGPDNDGSDLESVADIAEMGLLQNKDIPAYVKAYYLGLKNRALGYTGPNDEDSMIMENIYGEHVKNIMPTLRSMTMTQRKAPTAYSKRREKNAVVIKGDSFSEKINSMRKPSGDYTEDEIKAIGEQVANEIEAEAMRNAEKYTEIDKRMEEVRKEAYEKMRKTTKEESFTEWMNRRERENAILREEERKAEEEKNSLGKPVANALARVRKIGPSDPKEMRNHIPGRSTVRKNVVDAYNDYPTEWVEQSILEGSIHIKKTSRGYCSSNEIAISGEGKSADQTATHELGHRFERCVPGIVEAERNFYNRRTKDEPLVPLRTLTGIRYGWQEVARKDKFLNPYMGKDYKGSAYELVSMGFEMAFHRPHELMKDRDYAHFILGLLAVG